MIYNYLEKLVAEKEDKSVLNMMQMDREETIKAFEDFKKDNSNVIY